jgi:hypothetical protein
VLEEIAQSGTPWAARTKGSLARALTRKKSLRLGKCKRPAKRPPGPPGILSALAFASAFVGDTVMKLGSTIAGLAAMAAAACFIATPVDARTRDGSQRGACAKTAHSKKAVSQARDRHASAASERQRRLAERTQFSVKWHGWGGSFHLDGVRYAGGNPRGPAAWYNNWEGGFHPEAFWVLHARNSSP